MTSVATPRLRIEQACETLSRSEVVDRCLGLLAGGPEDPQFIVMLGGAPSLHLLGADLPPDQAYWLRVWAARGLLWAGPGDDLGALRSAFADESWRVRELMCKVAARHRLGDLLDAVTALESDPVARVRSAAGRAATRIVEAMA